MDQAVESRRAPCAPAHEAELLRADLEDALARGALMASGIDALHTLLLLLCVDREHDDGD